MSPKQIPVFDKHGNILGYVSEYTTSIGASKLAKGPTEYAKHPSAGWGWRKK